VSLLDAKSKVRIARAALVAGKPHAMFANGSVLRFHTRRANLAQVLSIRCVYQRASAAIGSCSGGWSANRKLCEAAKRLTIRLSWR
jgi:hypothetical protein